MSTTQHDFWPDDIAQVTEVPPVTILRQAASALGQRTNNLVEATIKTSRTGGGELQHEFVLVAPALDSYSYTLFSVTHEVLYYPVCVLFEGARLDIHTEEDFVAKLKEILSAPLTKKIVQSLVAQSET